MQPNRNKITLGIAVLASLIAITSVILLSLTRQNLTEAQQVAAGQSEDLAALESDQLRALTREAKGQLVATGQAVILATIQANESLISTREAEAVNDVAIAQTVAAEQATAIEMAQSNEAAALTREAEAVERADQRGSQEPVGFDQTAGEDRSNRLFSSALAGAAGALNDQTSQTNLLLAIESNLLFNGVDYTSNVAFIALNALPQRFPKLIEKTSPNKPFRLSISNSEKTQIATYSERGSVINIWDATTEKRIHTLELGEGSDGVAIKTVSWNADGTRILTLQENRSLHEVEAQFVQVWDAVTGELLRSFIEKDWYTLSVEWNSDSSQIVTSSVSGDVIIWDATSLEPVHILRHDDAVSQVRWNRDETQLLTNGRDAAVWDLVTGISVFTLKDGDTWWQDVQWNADETQILTVGGEDDLVSIWDATSGELVQTFVHGNGENWGQIAIWDSQEAKILTYSQNRIVKVWNAVNGALIHTIVQDDVIEDIKWNRAGTQILVSGGPAETGRSTGSASVWDAMSGELIYSFYHAGRVTGAEWNTAETQILTYSDDATAKIWDAASGKLVYLLEHDTAVIDASWHESDTEVLTSSADGEAWVWDVTEGIAGFKPLHSSPPVELNRNGTQLLSSQQTKGGAGSVVNVWDVEGNQPIHTLVPDGLVHTMHWNEGETEILTISKSSSDGEGIIALWNAKSGRLLNKFTHDQAVWQASWNGDGTQILSVSTDGSIRIWDTLNGERVYTLDPAQNNYSWRGELINAKWIANETEILTYGEGDTVNVRDSETGDLLHKITVGNETITDIQLNMTETQALILSHSRWDSTAELWDLTAGTLMHQFEHTGEEGDWVGPDGGLWHKDGTQILTYDEGGTAKVWDVSSGSLLFEFRYSDNYRALNSVRWHKDETEILTTSKDGAIKFWDASNGTLLNTLNHEASVWHVQWNRNETQMLTAEGNAAKVWDVSSGDLIHTLSHDAMVQVARWGKNETQLLTYGTDNLVKIWDAERGVLLFTIEGDGSSIHSAYWNEGETEVWVWTSEGNFYRYLMDAEARRKLACQRATRNLTWTEWQRYLPAGESYRRTCPNRPIHPSVPADERP